MIDFVHLHVHSDYSLLDGASKLGTLVSRAKELGFTALALTDHGNMFAAYHFYLAAKERGIKVITTTLASSRWKSLDQINEAGLWACRAISSGNNSENPDEMSNLDPLSGNTSENPDKVIWWDQNWRKGGLQERRLQIIKEYDFYNQLYCGCEFSMRKD